jgi:hypothetical protein
MSANIPIKDANATTQYLRSQEASGIHTPYNIIVDPDDLSHKLALDASGRPTVNVNGTLTTTGLTEAQLLAASLSIGKFPAIAKDAFGRLRVSNPAYRFDSQLTYGVDSELWDTLLVNGTATHSTTERWIELSANASGVNSVIFQSHYHAPYTAGRGQLVHVLTGLTGWVSLGLVQRQV